MTFYTIHPRELEDIMRRKHGILIDVREADSYREYHYPIDHCSDIGVVLPQTFLLRLNGDIIQHLRERKTAAQ